VCSTTVCPVHNFPPPSELLVCYQPHRQGVMPGQKSIYETFLVKISSLPQGDDSSPPPLCGLIFFEGDRCLCLTLKFVERLKCYSAKPNESCIIFGIYYFISCLISIVILSLCIFLFLLSFLVRYRVKTMQEKEKMCQTVA
jgi:hypothetical protein